ncbi:hypothetical protein A2524_01325 [Candidatus Wolfebacteria bacterium RIFOXYD12_FULL_48_21]|uniref:histidine kinase n=1 Tax=Candidatus Wolfebacteria bacterium RIFOXYD1_FULL_48_65 TaxID=1802561 RepID=A0A1F8DYZ9_9BACT|nr:MAG: hypothetical protein A2610_00510 [Candidatus Wolfebacteria bacterium RIFOXYD1_FULL_48_65]OGM94449.1 MAG: hypothetical protein A2524_01325 [Candidatus Wolfebacteria bacterium RIFOXYD12_FULL_48_21]OGM97164.1 MAG: hypothetical protein A2532_01980 [Candidatus Wolfebacteria bacterium RIFOXYD2_FULL_48_11]
MKKTLSIKNKITLAFVGITIFFGAITAVGVFVVVRQNLSTLKKDDITLRVVSEAREVAQAFDGSVRLSKTITAQSEIADYLQQAHPVIQDPNVVALLRRYSVDDLYDAIFVMDSKGSIIASTELVFVGIDRSSRDYFKQAIVGVPFIEFGIGAVTGKPGYYFSQPVINGRGEIVGVVVIKFPARGVLEIVERFADEPFGHSMLVDADGIVVHSDIPDHVYKAIGALSQEKRQSITAENRIPGGSDFGTLHYDPIVSILQSYRGPTTIDFYDNVEKKDKVISVSRVADTSFFLVIESDAETLTTSAYIISAVPGIGVFFAALFAAIIGYILVARFLRPLKLLKAAAQKIGEGDYAYRVSIETGDEFEEVADAFEDMAQKIQVSYADLDRRVAEQTAKLSLQLQEFEQKNIVLRDTQRAVLNVLEDSHTLELQLQDERDYLRGILASMGEGLFVLNKDLRIVLTNSMAGRILGIPSERLENAFLPSIITFYKGEETIPEKERPLHRVINDRVSITANVEDNFYWEVRGGKRFPLGLTAAPISTQLFTGGVIVFRDLTNEKNIGEARTSFISIASHQLRTPLTSLKWFLEMLMDGSYAQPLTPEQKNFADLAYQSADRMMGIINLLLQIARVEAGRIKVAPTPTDLGEFVRESVASLGNIFALKKQAVEVLTNPDHLTAVPVDVDIFGQVMQNLLSNANRYAFEDSTIRVMIVEEHNRYVCSITNEGIGISRADESRIFEKFYRAENALRMVPEGSGLGLSLVKSLVEGWGGKIWFESKEGAETTFYFTIPLVGMDAREGKVGVRIS